MLTQIYEIASPEEALAISAIGVDHIGVLVGTGEFPRETPLARAASIARAIAPPSKFSALFLAADILMVESWARQLRPAIVLWARRRISYHQPRPTRLRRNCRTLW